MQEISSLSSLRSLPEAAQRTNRLSGMLRLLIPPLALLLIYLAAFTSIQFRQTSFIDNDSYYHMRMAALVREQGLKVDFTWLPLSILNREEYTNHHLLHHLFLSLFVGDGSPEALVAGGKVATVIMAALVGLAFWAVLQTAGVRRPEIWALALLGLSGTFLFRMSLTRAISASLILQLLAVLLLLKRRYIWLAPLAFMYVWWYDGYLLLMAVVAAYVVAVRLSERRMAWGALIWPVVGLAIGLVTHPYFPNNLQSSILGVNAENLFKVVSGTMGAEMGSGELMLDRPIAIGGEWSPYGGASGLVPAAGLACAVWMAGVWLTLRPRRTSDLAIPRGWMAQLMQRLPERDLLFALFLSLGFGLLLMMAERFIEYFPAYALLLLALASRPLIERLRLRRPRTQALALLGALVAVTAGWSYVNISSVDLHATDAKIAQYADAAAWLKENAPPDSRIFLSLWDMFPQLFFYNDSVEYTLGLDPKYTYRYDPELFVLYDHISRGLVEQPGPIIRERFGAQYVLLRSLGSIDVRGQPARRLPGIVKTATDDPTMELVYDRGDLLIYRIDAP